MSKESSAPKTKTQKKNDKYRTCASQTEIPVKWIQDSIICTTDNRYITMVEIMPVNFFKKTPEKADFYMDNFSRIFKNCPTNMFLMILSDTTNPSRIIEHSKAHCKNQNLPEIENALLDYETHITNLSNTNAVSKRYIFGFEYSGMLSDGTKSNKFSDIKKELFAYRQSVIDVMSVSDNPCYIPENWHVFVVETLYYIFNRQTSRTQTLKERVDRIQADYKKFNQARPGEKPKTPTYADYIAPKGIQFVNRSRIVMDGLFYSYIGIQGDSIPIEQVGPYLERFSYGSPVDIIIPIKKLPRSITKATIKFKNNQSKQSIYSNRQKHKDEKADLAAAELTNGTFIQKALDAGQDLFDIAIILAIRDDSAKRLENYISRIESALQTMELSYDTSFLCVEDYFKMCMPFLYFTEPFHRIKRNYITDSTSTLYDFVSVEMLDPQGIAFATNNENHSLMSVNIFNTSLFKNANVCILGTSGSGKTFTEQWLARLMRLSGIRTFFIIPKKGRFDYLKQSNALNGSFIDFFPGAKNGINPLAIIPEGNINKDLLGDDVSMDNGSLVAKKVVNVIIWIQLLMGKEELGTVRYHALNSAITELYAEFGISIHDNRSIYEDYQTGKLKYMPQIEDLQKKVLSIPVLKDLSIFFEPFITGNCQNLNCQTNVDLDNEYTVFNVDEELIGEDMLPSFLFIAFEFVYGKIKEDPMSLDVLFLDEVWKMMKTEDCAKQVQNIVKLVRGYCGAVITATQEIEDLMKAKGDFGKSVINNSEIKILLNMKESEVAEVQPVIRFSNDIARKIEKFKRGQGVFIANGDITEINIVPSQLAIKTISPKAGNAVL